MFSNTDIAVPESSPGLAMHVTELIMQLHTPWLTAGGKVGEAEKTGSVGQLWAMVFVTR